MNYPTMLYGIGLTILAGGIAYLALGVYSGWQRRRQAVAVALLCASFALLAFASAKLATPPTPTSALTADVANTLSRIERLLAARLPGDETKPSHEKPVAEIGGPPSWSPSILIVLLVVGVAMFMGPKLLPESSKVPRLLLAVLSELAGIASMFIALFGLFSPAARPQPVAGSLSMELFEVRESLPPFWDASASEPRSKIESAICRVREELNAGGSRSAIVVGRHDRRELSPKAVAQFGSNSGLAQQRADRVGQLLQDFELCGGSSPVRNFIVVTAGPSNTHRASYVRNADWQSALARDRRVEIFGLRTERPSRGETPK